LTSCGEILCVRPRSAPFVPSHTAREQRSTSQGSHSVLVSFLHPASWPAASHIIYPNWREEGEDCRGDQTQGRVPDRVGVGVQAQAQARLTEKASSAISSTLEPGEGLCGCRQTWRTPITTNWGKAAWCIQSAGSRGVALPRLSCRRGLQRRACASTESSTTSWAPLRQSGTASK
jgi:hypothetical protein